MFINRSFIDERLNYSGSEFENLGEQEDNKYEQLYDESDLTTGYDFSNM